MKELVVESHIQTDRWDKFGILLSSLCAIHCLVTPVLFLFLPLMAEKFENPIVHILMALFVVPVGAFAFISGYIHHRNKRILSLGLVGVALVGGAALLPLFANHAHELEAPLTIVGSLCLLTAHFWNRRSCKCGHNH